MPNITGAKPSQLVKCPECGKEVRARGLKSHIRLSHLTTPEGRIEEARATGEKQSGNLDNLIDNLVDKLIDNQGEEARAVEEDRQVETRGAGQEPSRAPRSEAQSHKPRKRKKKDSSVALASSGEESGEGGSEDFWCFVGLTLLIGGGYWLEHMGGAQWLRERVRKRGGLQGLEHWLRRRGYL